MGVNSEFGIKTTVDNSGIDSLIDRLSKVLETAKAVEKQFGPIFDEIGKGFQKMSSMAVDEGGKVVKAQKESSDRQAALLAAQVAKQEAAAAKIVAAQEAKNAKIAAAQDAENAKRQAKAQALSRAMQAYEADDAESVKRFAELKAEYENKSTDEIRAKIHSMNEAVREERVKLANTVRTLTQEGDKEAAAAAKNEYQTRINVDEKELQQFRLLEQERVGRTFAEIQERIHAEGTGNKEIIAMLETSAAKEEELQKKITVTFEAEEKKRLQAALNEAKQETAAIKQEADNRNININVSAHAEAHSSGIGLPQIAMIGAATEALSGLVEKSGEVREANKAMEVSFGEGTEKAKEQAEEIGKAMGKTDSETGALMAQIHAATGAQDADLEKYTKAYIAANDAGIKISAKSLQSEAGMQKLMQEGMPLVANAMKTAQEPAQQAALAQKNVGEEAGKLADTLLTGLAPVLSDISPLISTLGGVATDILTPALAAISFILAPVIDTLTTLKPILPYLAIAVGVVAAAMWVMNGAILAQNLLWLANPITWVIAAIVALIVIVVQLVKHWDDVTAALKSVWDTLSSVGDSVLSFLGITSKAEAATKKHTAALKDNKKSLEEIAKAAVDAAQKTLEYTDTLEKNTEELNKNAKQGQDDAIAAVADIQTKLKTATGKEKEILEQRLQQWTEYGQRQRAITDAQDKAAQDAKDKIYGKEEVAPDTKGAKKAAKSKEDIAKESADTLLNTRKEEIAAEKATDAQKHIDEINAEIVHATALLAIAQKFHGDKSAQAKSEQNKLTVLRDTLQKDERAAQLDDQKSATDDLLSDLEQRGIKESLSDYQIAQERYKIEQKALQDEITLRASWGEDVSKLQAQFDTAELKHADEEKKNTIAAEKELAQIKDEARKQNIQDMQAHHVAASVVAKAETQLALDEEDTRHAEEMEKRKGNDALLEAEIADHTGKVTAITKAGADKQNQIWLQQAQFAAGPISNAFNNAFKGMTKGLNTWTDNLAKSNNFAQSFFGSLLQGFTQMVEGLVIKFVEFEAAFEVLNLITGGGAAAIMGAFNVAGALGIPGHAEGTDNSPGGFHWVGEKGPELLNMRPGAQVIPNHQINQSQSAPDFTPLLHALNTSNRLAQQSNATLAAIHEGGKPGYGSSQGLYNLTRGQQMASRIVNRRQLK